jgi:hypothetical protein
MKKILFIVPILFVVILLVKLYFNSDYYFSGFYKDNKTNKYFYTDNIGSINDSIKNKVKFSVPILKKNGDTLKDVDIKSFVRINDFYKDDFYVYRIVKHADFLSVIAEPIAEIKYECYFENSFYEIIKDSIFYNSPAGESCNGFLLRNKSKTFHVLDLDDVNHDCAIDKDLIFINGCIINRSDLIKLDEDILDKINFSIKNKIYKKVIEIGGSVVK